MAAINQTASEEENCPNAIKYGKDMKEIMEVTFHAASRLHSLALLKQLNFEEKKAPHTLIDYQCIPLSLSHAEQIRNRFKAVTEAAITVCLTLADNAETLQTELRQREKHLFSQKILADNPKNLEKIFTEWLREVNYFLDSRLKNALGDTPAIVWMEKAAAYASLLQAQNPVATVLGIDTTDITQRAFWGEIKTYACQRQTPLSFLTDTALRGFLYPSVTHPECPQWYASMPDFEKKLFNYTFREFNCCQGKDPGVIHQTLENLKNRFKHIPDGIHYLSSFRHLAKEELFYAQEIMQENPDTFLKKDRLTHWKWQFFKSGYSALLNNNLIDPDKETNFLKINLAQMIQHYIHEHPDMNFVQLGNQPVFLQGVFRNNQIINLPKYIKIFINGHERSYSPTWFTGDTPNGMQSLLTFARFLIYENHPAAASLQVLVQQWELTQRKAPKSLRNQLTLHQRALASMIAKRTGCIACSVYDSEYARKTQWAYESAMEIYWQRYKVLPDCQGFLVQDNWISNQDENNFLALYRKILHQDEEMNKEATLFTLQDPSQVKNTWVSTLKNHDPKPLYKARLRGVWNGIFLSMPVTVILFLLAAAFILTSSPLGWGIFAAVMGVFCLVGAGVLGGYAADADYKKREMEKWDNPLVDDQSYMYSINQFNKEASDYESDSFSHSEESGNSHASLQVDSEAQESVSFVVKSAINPDKKKGLVRSFFLPENPSPPVQGAAVSNVVNPRQ